MNRAARIFTEWLIRRYPDSTRPILILAGTGNNGGDGVVAARLLDMAQYAAKLVVCDFGTRHSADFDQQLAALSDFSPVKPLVIRQAAEIESILTDHVEQEGVIVDALFGSGLNRPLTGDWSVLIDKINESGCDIISIDVPSGLLCDEHTPGEAVVQATTTFSFQTPKRAFFFPENAGRVGELAWADIGLLPEFEAETATPFGFFTWAEAVKQIKPRAKFSHKGSYGHTLIIAGSYGKMGAAVLAARACLRAGAGLLTVHAPLCGNLVLQTTVPEAMFSADQRARCWTNVPDLAGYAAIGVGPGIGRDPQTAVALLDLIQRTPAPLVLDADALNLLSENPEWLNYLPEKTILTPHPKEFERLFGKSANDFERNGLQRAMSQKHGVIIVLKGAHTAVSLPDGTCCFNETGNPGMATGGSGDVLTGVITGLLAQGYAPEMAARLGVSIHGRAGDRAVGETGRQALMAGDLVEFLGREF